MKSFTESMREDRRLVLLRFLDESDAFTLNSSQLHTGLTAFGIQVSRADLLADLRWLANQGALTMESVVDGVYVCQLTRAGADIAAGTTHVEGIARPRPH